MILQSIKVRKRYRFVLLCLAVTLLSGCGSGNAQLPATEASTPTTSAPASGVQATATPAPTAAQVAAAETPAPAAGDKVPAPQTVSEGAASKLEPTARDGMYAAPPEMTIDTAKYYYATFKTDKGDIKAQLFVDRAPVTVNNFVFLAREGFYNNTVFHRVLENFMAQAGDPTGTGMGGPGYQFPDEFAPGLAFDRPGLLAMANSGPGTNGSQFFITFAPTDWLNERHTIFGEVVEGQEILGKLTRRDPNNPSIPGDTLYTVLIEEGDVSSLPTPTPLPPTPTPFAPSAVQAQDRPLAKLPAAERTNYFNIAPELVIDTSKTYSATIKTSKGDLTVALYDDDAPVAVNNFVALANLGFYDGLPINQISPGQMVIFGAPDNNPRSDAGYKVAAEVNLPEEIGIGSIAYIPQQNAEVTSSSSQVLLALIKPPDEAKAGFSFFGQITTGLEILPQLTTTDTIVSITVTVSE